MIKLRKNVFSETSIDIPFLENEKADALLVRALNSNGFSTENSKVLDSFHVVVNGHIVPQELLIVTLINEKDDVLICTKIAGGESGQVFKQFAIVAITVVAAYFGGPAGLGLSGAGLAAFTVAASLGASLALNALIPPPVPGGLGGLNDFTGNTLESSQMYSITNQSNQPRKFGTVPKVYGSHRMFPVLVAAPYTELAPDPNTGKIVQYFYAIYDFGMGVMNISEIKIGNTDFEQYADSVYRLVDPNDPIGPFSGFPGPVPEGPWEGRFNYFELYRGDVERDGTVAEINENQNDGGPVDGYQVIRNAATNNENDLQEIILDFVCPEGLISYDTNAGTYMRQIAVKIEFSKVGENVWKTFNNPTYCSSFSTVGAGSQTTDYPLRYESNLNNIANFTLLYSQFENINSFSQYDSVRYVDTYGYPIGTTQIFVEFGTIGVGSLIFYNNTLVGEVSDVQPSPLSGHQYAVLANPTTFIVPVLKYVGYAPLNVPITANVGGLQVRQGYAGIALIQATDPNPVYCSVRFVPRELGEFKVRIIRLQTASASNYQPKDRLTLTSLTTRFDRSPIVTDKRHVFIEVRVKATGQLNGTISNLSAIVDSVLDVYDPNTETWSKQPTNNPAWVFCDLLTGDVNKKAIPKSRLHMDSIVEWANYCDEIPDSPMSRTYLMPRFRCNFILDFSTTLQNLLNSVCGASQASINVIDGKYGVLLDTLRTTPVQIFTPRNSSNFSSSRSYSDIPHGLKVRFIEPNLDWESHEIVVYSDGYDENNAEKFEDMSAFAVTNMEQAWRFGRYMMAQALLRRETISIEVDFEYLVCTRGDYVQVTQDVMKVGGTPARVKSVSGNTIKIDDGIDTNNMLSYGYVHRSSSGVITTSTLTVVDSDEFTVDGVIPAVGDLVIIGVVGQLVFDCLVKSITPSNDLKATLTLIEKQDAVYDAESTDTFPTYNPQLNQNIDPSLLAPGLVNDLAVIANTWTVVGSAYQYYVDLDWNLPTGSAVESYEIYVDDGTGYRLRDVVTDSEYRYIVDEDRLGVEHKFKVLAVSSTGKKRNLIEASEVTATPEEKTTPPSDVLDLFINITNQVIQLNWPAVADIDLKEYRIRYTPDTLNGTWETSNPLLTVARDTTMVSTQGRVGTYLIKAIDLNGNESINTAQVITSIPNLFDLNVIASINDFPALNGTVDQLVISGDSLILDAQVPGDQFTIQYYPEGYYYYEDLLILEDIFSIRLQSLVQSEGFTVGDFMSEWVTLASVDFLSSALTSQWEVETQYRATNTLNVMADWTSLVIIDPLSEGNQDNWTPWRTFTIGDFTGRIFQFRLKLVSNVPNVSPRVLDGLIKADVPDRLESYENVIVPNTGLDITYTPSFLGPGGTPNVQASIDDAEQGDYYVISNKTLDGFRIDVYDKLDNQVQRQVDIAVKGFGRKSTIVL